MVPCQSVAWKVEGMHDQWQHGGSMVEASSTSSVYYFDSGANECDSVTGGVTITTSEDCGGCGGAGAVAVASSLRKYNKRRGLGLGSVVSVIRIDLQV